MRVWLERFGSDGPPSTQLLEVLAAAGVDVDVALRSGDPQRCGPGIVVFDRVTQDVTACIRDAARAGAERVIAIDTQAWSGSDDEAWALLEAGASDVIAWESGGDIGEALAARFRRWQDVDRLMASKAVRDRMVGDSAAWTSVLRRLVEVAHFTDASVLVTGESGTGKELVARMVHDLDARRDKASFVVVDCTTVVPSLSGSEFFGHEKGAFTGATSSREGAFALADRGTLFLDEVGELSLPLQAELLRVIQEGTYKRVGSNVWRETRFRLVCATNRDLAQEQCAGTFRPDLYFRIGGCTAQLPSLRARTEDIPALVERFFRELRPGTAPPDLAPAVRSFLLSRAYPGNIRDLRHLVARLSHRHVGPGPVTIGDIPEDERPSSPLGRTREATPLDTERPTPPPTGPLPKVTSVDPAANPARSPAGVGAG